MNDLSCAEPTVRIPLAGNAFLETTRGGGSVTPDGFSGWTSADAVFGVYVRFAGAAVFTCSIRLNRTQEAAAVISVSSGEREYTVALPEGCREVRVGEFSAPGEGYVRFALRGLSKTGKTFGEPAELVFDGITRADISSCIYPEEADNFYWTRRGPSVHCGYDIRDFGNVEWFYNEVTVPEGYDPVGSYYMGIGFSGGYFGIQTNSRRVRRILFSVWSPHVTDDPSAIPEELRVRCLGKHERTHAGEFGGEGSGGQSYMEYSWKTGETQKFLMHVRPDGCGSTEFTAYFFFPETGRFERIASFSRPKTDTWLVRPHSFLENFHDTAGHLTRMAYYGNAWAYTADGRWLAPERIRLTGDNTARKGWRLDYDGGFTEDGRFYLKNGGFFDRHGQLDSIFIRDTSVLTPPDFDPNELIR